MTPVKVGDYVRVADREATAADLKSGLFYNYFRSLTGTIERIYDDNTVCIDVEIEALPEDIRSRHTEIQESARDKWIRGLSQEQRSRLTEQDKQFNMSYKVIVAAADVQSAKKGSKSKSAAPQQKTDTSVKSQASPTRPETKRRSGSAAKTSGESGQKRLTEMDLEAAEEAFLKSLDPGKDKK